MWRRSLFLITVAGFVVAACGGGPTAAKPPSPAAPSGFEVWVLDQNPTTTSGGGTVSVYRGSDLAGAAAPEPAYTIDLGKAAAGVGVGMAPHNITFTPTGTHAVISYVASGHVQVVRTADRTVVASIRMTPSKTGTVQAHNTTLAPKGDYMLVANQAGKRLQRIVTDFGHDSYRLDSAADLDLAALENAEHSNNEPSVAVFSSDGSTALVPMRGGGAYLVNPRSTPMSVLATLGKSDLAPNACCAVAFDGGFWMTGQGNSSGTTAYNLYRITGGPSTLSAKVIAARTGRFESHSLLLMARGAELWLSDRFAHVIDVYDTASGQLLRSVPLASGPLAGKSPAPDILLAAPGGLAFVTLRGPTPVTSNIKGLDNAVGDSPGIAVLDSKTAVRLYVPLSAVPGVKGADPHGAGVRVLR
jgi:hypothetical protein